MKIFISYYSDDKGVAEEICEYLNSTFKSAGLEIFMASTWDSIAPGDDWEDKIINALKETNALLVLMSIDALGRPWINFELGVAWSRQVRILIFCHKGMTPSALPRPYGSLQAEDLNNLNEAQRNQRVGDAVAKALSLRPPSQHEGVEVAIPAQAGSFFLTNRALSLRPAGHVGETVQGRFLVGVVRPAHLDRAKAAGLHPGEALCVRLFTGPTPESPYINAFVSGDAANYFERVQRDTTSIDAKIRLAGTFTEEDSSIPLLVIDEYKPVRPK